MVIVASCWKVKVKSVISGVHCKLLGNESEKCQL